ncbi:hypothetical protein HGP29_24370 [Flammeovirga sp. SR4]|uniref:Uncharacterized protein n=2 Tax=Flammeovirga agarivorans TaxID=2726742 RepID=A0A7X8SQ74_9BACT|nr:hypothetical protein [Flammeovirga agarivorans]
MKCIRFTTLISILLLLGISDLMANDNKYVFAVNSLRFINTPQKGILSHINAGNYFYDESKKNWVKNNELFYPTDTDLVSPLTLEDAVDLELQMAMKNGINGFALLYTISRNRKILDTYDEIVNAYVEVIKKKGYDFKLMMAIKFERGVKVNEGIYDCGTHLSKIYGSTKNSNVWYKMKGKKALMFYKSKGLMSADELKSWEKSKDNELDMSAYFDRFSEITSYLSTDVSIIYNALWPGRKKEIELALDRFETVFFEKSRMLRQGKIDILARIIKSKNRPFVQTVFHSGISSYYVMKDKNKKKPQRFVMQSKIAIDDCYKEYDNLHYTRSIRDGFKSAEKNNAELIILDSWNIFIEQSHFRPSYNNGWGLSVLLKSYINEYQGKPNEESLVMSFLPYQNTDGKGFLAYKPRKNHSYKDDTYERKNIEIVTNLDKAGDLYFRNKLVKTIPAGRFVTTVPWSEGEVKAFVKRDGLKVLEIYSTKKISYSLYRNNPSKAYVSSKDPELYDEMVTMLAKKEVDFFNNRFLLPRELYNQWISIEKEKMTYYTSTLLSSIEKSDDAIGKMDKYHKKYKAKIKALLSEFNYSIWDEIINEKMEYLKPLADYDIHEFENSYNVLPAN